MGLFDNLGEKFRWLFSDSTTSDGTEWGKKLRPIYKKHIDGVTYLVVNRPLSQEEYELFLESDIPVNWCDIAYFNIHYKSFDGFIEDNKTNSGCGNCVRCKGCTDCFRCFDCDDCVRCQGLTWHEFRKRPNGIVGWGGNLHYERF